MVNHMDDRFLENRVVNPFDNPYLNENGVNGTYSEQLFYAAGQSSEFSQAGMLIILNSFLLWPVVWSMCTSILEFTVAGYVVRSDLIATLVWGFFIPGIFIAAGGMYSGRDMFVWLKVYSLVLAHFAIAFVKYLSGYPRRSQVISWTSSAVIHGMLFLNIMEAAIWEAAKIKDGPYNIISGIVGVILALTAFVYTYTYGVGVVESQGGKVRQMQSNITPTYVLCYMFWNIEYNASYHPSKGAYYIFLTVVTPTVVAFIGHMDWLETRAKMLMVATSIRLFPYGGNGPALVTLGLFQWVWGSDEFRWAMTILSVVFCIVLCIESYVIMVKGGTHFRLWPLPKYAFNISDRHPREAVNVVVDAMVRRASIRLEEAAAHIPGRRRKSSLAGNEATIKSLDETSPEEKPKAETQVTAQVEPQIDADPEAATAKADA